MYKTFCLTNSLTWLTHDPSTVRSCEKHALNEQKVVRSTHQNSIEINLHLLILHLIIITRHDNKIEIYSLVLFRM